MIAVNTELGQGDKCKESPVSSAACEVAFPERLTKCEELHKTRECPSSF
jgi:hypothetical protein